MRERNCFTFKISGRRDFQICRVLEKYNRYLLFVAPPSSPLILADQGGRNISHLFPLINLTQKRELKIRKHPIYIYIHIFQRLSPSPSLILAHNLSQFVGRCWTTVVETAAIREPYNNSNVTVQNGNLLREAKFRLTRRPG